ncbi:ExeM/NucH family extracellular endonuclease [Corynebacterium sp. LK2590]|uniref:ExeM/NucH family extracellular endonuclease n=1 Tax=unclassified Corynebacterium TaxID=2624378 RepID=UPI0034CE61A8
MSSPQSSRRVARRRGALVLAAVTSTVAAGLAVPTASAAPSGDNVVISEVYGGGGNSGAEYTHDFIELYNPTDGDISLDGWNVEYFSAKGGSGGTTQLNGTIPAGAHYLIQQAQGNGGNTALPAADATGSLAMSATKGSVQLSDGAGEVVDLVGFGEASLSEGSPAQAPNNRNSVQRDENGTDTDDNSADFTAGAPSPAGTGGGVAPEPGTDPEPQDPPAAGEAVAIADIQGTGPASPLVDQTVTTEGVVTAVWEEGGLNGYTIQTGGESAAGEASHGLFIYAGNDGAYPEIGQSVQVTGKVSEYYGNTQVSARNFTELEEPLEHVEPIEIDELPAGDEAREAYESMLVLPGTHTVTNNYALNTYGEVGLAAGQEALRQPSDVHAPSTDPNSPLKQLEKDNAERLVTLDDGRTRDYLKTDKDTPLPYISQDGGQTIKSLRTTDQVKFQQPVVVHYSHEQWRFQPTSPVTGETAGADLPISWEDSRAAELDALDVEGDYTIGAFNVLNYFTSLGEEFGGSSYDDKDGNPVTVNRGTTRGAYTQAAFEDQQAKIVAAINGLDADVIALSEIEDTFGVTGDLSRRDEALNHLVEELNAAGGNWKAVASPSQGVPEDVDVIRTAFIYDPDRVRPVGESRIFSDARFTGTAREPLAQEFAPADAGEDAETFVAVANHFKSKGSVVKDDADRGDGQGNNPNVRNAQAQAVLDHLAKQPDWQDKATFVMGDLNTYTREEALDIFRNHGYTVPAETFDADASYQFSGLLGSLDHVLANEVASENVTDAQVWNINADESVAFEYSRRNYNAVDFYDDSPFRSSDHDPVKVGFSLGGDDAAGDDENGNDGDDNNEDDDQGQPAGSGDAGSSGSSVGGAVVAVIAGLAAVLGIGTALAGGLRGVLPMLPADVRRVIERLLP